MEDFVLGLDLDGVVGDYEAAFRASVARQKGVPASTIPRQESWSYAGSSWPIATHEEYIDLHRTAVMQDRIFRDMPLIGGASDGLWRLSDAGVWVRVITSRLIFNSGHARVVADTVEFLDQGVSGPATPGRKAIPYRDICFIGEKASVGCDLYVDDAPHNIAALRAEGAEVICFSQPYNLHVEGPRADNWVELVSMVLEAKDKKARGSGPGLLGNGRPSRLPA